MTMAYALETSQEVGPRDTDSTYALAFCIALQLMSENPPHVLGPDWPARDEATPCARWRECLGRYLNHPDEPSLEANCICKVYPPDSYLGDRARALMAVGIFSVLLREAYENGRIRRHQNFLPRSPIMSFPSPTSIPFHLLMDVPLPFSPDAAEKFSSCHLARMTTVDFLQDGEWTGFYAMSFDYKNPALFDPPMRGIRFAATANSDSETTLYGTGEDSVGAFHLEGTLGPSTGNIRLTKMYEGGLPVWNWECLMTPVGIVGCWGCPEYGGWLWLWKTGWTADL